MKFLSSALVLVMTTAGLPWCVVGMDMPMAAPMAEQSCCDSGCVADTSGTGDDGGPMRVPECCGLAAAPDQRMPPVLTTGRDGYGRTLLSSPTPMAWHVGPTPFLLKTVEPPGPPATPRHLFLSVLLI